MGLLDHLRAGLAGILMQLAAPATTRARRLRIDDIATLLDREDVLVVDTETTGVGPGAEVIEIAAIDTTGTPREHALVLPSGPISHRSWEIHGITLEALHAQGARPWPEIMGRVAPLLGNAKTVIAWSADFDARVLAQTGAAYNIALPTIAWADVRPAYRDTDPRGQGSLASAMRREKLAWEGRQHRAQADCRATLAVMRTLARRA